MHADGETRKPEMLDACILNLNLTGSNLLVKQEHNIRTQDKTSPFIFFESVLQSYTNYVIL